jgi:hypothetical protein
MSQPEDEETKEHPAYPSPPEAMPDGQPDESGTVSPIGDEATDAAPVDATPPTTPPAPAPDTATPPSSTTWQQPATPPVAPPAPVVPAIPPPAPPPAPQWQQPAAPQWQQPGAPQGEQAWQQPGGAGWQPTAPGWQQQPPQQWQQPPVPPYGGPPGWPGQQPYAPGPRYSTSVLVAVAGLLLLLFGLIDAVGGVWLLGQGNELRQFIQRINSIGLFGVTLDREVMRSVLSPMPGILIVFGALEILAGAGIFAHKGWARGIGILIALIGLIVSVVAVSFAIALASGMSVPLVAAVATLLGNAFIFVALIAGGRHFRDRYAGGPVLR